MPYSDYLILDDMEEKKKELKLVFRRNGESILSQLSRQGFLVDESFANHFEERVEQIRRMNQSGALTGRQTHEFRRKVVDEIRTHLDKKGML